MEKQDAENAKKSFLSANYLHPTFSELSKSNAIHGALMGNLSDLPEGSFLYNTAEGIPIHFFSQLITYSRDNIRIYNIEMKNEPSRIPSRATIDYKLNLTHEIPLFGEIKKISMIYNNEEGEKHTKKGYLVIFLSENKMATLSLDPLTNSLSIVDLHNFENPGTDLLRKGQLSYANEPIMKIDKFNRCVAILMYHHVLTLVLTQSFYKSLDVNLTSDITILPNYAALNKDSTNNPPFYGMTYYFNLADYNLNNPVDFTIVEFSKELRIYILNQQQSVNKGRDVTKNNICELVGFKLNKNFFTLPLWEKNKLRESPKENLEIYSCCMKFKFLPSDCFKVICLLRGGFLVFTTYAVFYFDVVQGKDECVGFLVNQQYENTEEYSKLYYKCNIINRKLDCQINLRNYQVEALDSRHILLSGIGSYLLRLDLKKEGLVENMELIKIPDLLSTRISFISVHGKSQKDNIYRMLIGSYMSNANFVEFELFPEPRLDLQLSKMVRMEDTSMDRGMSQMGESFYKLTTKDTIETMSPISDLIAPKISSSNPFHLIASCSYGTNSSLLFMQTRVELNPTEMWDIDFETKHILSIKTPESNSHLTKYLLLSKEKRTEVLICNNAQLSKSKPEETLFFLESSTFQSKRLKAPNYSILIQATPSLIRFIDTTSQQFRDFSIPVAFDCRVKGNSICVLTTERSLEVYNFFIPPENLLQNLEFKKQKFAENSVSCFSLFQRRKVFPKGWNKNDNILGVAYQDHSIKLFIISEQTTKSIQMFFYCPHVNEGMPNLLNILDEGEKASSSLLTRIVTSSSIPNPTNIKMKPSCNFTIEEIYLKELYQSILLIVRLSNGECYFYKSYTSEFSPRFTLGYSFAFQKILYGAPLFKFNALKRQDSQTEKQMSIEEYPLSEKITRTIFKHNYFKGRSCICICSEEIYIWLFFKKDEIFFHSTRKDPSQAFRSLCDFFLPDCDNLFSGLVNKKISVFGLNDLSLDFENSLPLKKVPINKTIRNLLYFPFEEPRFIVFVTSYRNPVEEIFSLNLMEIKNQKLMSSIGTDNSSIVKIKRLTLNINGAMIPLIAVIYFQKRSFGTAAYTGKVSLYNVEKNNELVLWHEIIFENDAVTDVFEIKGFLFVCKGNVIQWHKISMREDRKFYDEQISLLFTEKFLIMDTLVLPNFLICSDLRRSLSIFYWQPENPIKLTPKGESFKTVTLYATEFFDSLADNLRVVSADNQKNIALLSFSITSQKVEKVADFHVGALITKFRRHRAPQRNHDTFLLSTSEGGLGFIGTFDSGYRNLATLQNILAIEFPFIAGLHPKSYRLYRTNDFNQRVKPKKNFLDGKLLHFYCHLSYSMQTKIAKSLKDTRENLLNLIYSLFSINNIF